MEKSSPAIEADRISRLMKGQHQLPSSLPNEGPSSEENSRREIPPEQTPSVLDARNPQDPYTEGPMGQKMRDASNRQKMFTGPDQDQTPTTTAPRENTPEQIQPTKGSIGQRLASFQKSIHAAERFEEEGNEEEKKKAVGGQMMDAARKVKLVKERYRKIRDLTVASSGVGLLYYIPRMDLTILNRYVLKKKYLWGYRDQKEYARDSSLRWSDLIELLEWFIFVLIRVICILQFIVQLFIIDHIFSLLGL